MSLESFSPQELLSKGQQAEREGNFPQAIKFYIAAQKKNPRLQYVYTALGNAYVRNKEPGQAIKSYKRSIELTEDKNAHHNLGLVYFHLKMYDHASHHLAQAEKQGIAGDDIYFYLAKSFFLTRRFEDAERIILKGLKKTKNQKLADIHKKLKEEKERLSDKFPGEAKLLAMIKKNPEHLPSYNLLAVFHFKHNNFDKGEALLKDAVKNNPKNLIAYTNLAGYYFDKERWKDACLLLDKAITISPEMTNVNINLYLNLAQSYLKLDEKKSAIKILEKLLKQDPPKREIVEKMIEGIKKDMK
jgi:Flp pilus assembly protein TadD